MIETHDGLNTTPQPDDEAESISRAQTLRDFADRLLRKGASREHVARTLLLATLVETDERNLDRIAASQAKILMRAGLLMPIYLDDRVGQADIDNDR
jgi:hypothetical protein